MDLAPRLEVGIGKVSEYQIDAYLPDIFMFPPSYLGYFHEGEIVRDQFNLNKKVGVILKLQLNELRLSIGVEYSFHGLVDWESFNIL